MPTKERQKYMREYVRRKRNRRRAYIRSVLGEECVACGGSRNLFYSRKDPRETSLLTKMLASHIDKINSELQKTIVICRSCDRKRRREAGLVREYPLSHGEAYAIFEAKCTCDICTDPQRVKEKREERAEYERNRKKAKKSLNLSS